MWISILVAMVFTSPSFFWREVQIASRSVTRGNGIGNSPTQSQEAEVDFSGFHSSRFRAYDCRQHIALVGQKPYDSTEYQTPPAIAVNVSPGPGLAVHFHPRHTSASSQPPRPIVRRTPLA
jgi:hypothetical protein